MKFLSQHRELMKEALAAAQAIQDEDTRARVLSGAAEAGGDRRGLSERPPSPEGLSQQGARGLARSQ